MEKITSFHGFTPPLSRNNILKKPPTYGPTHILTPRAASVAFDIQPSPVSLSASSSLISPILDLFGDPGKLKSLNSVREMHAHMMKLPKGLRSDSMVKNLILSYLRFSDFQSAVMVFFLGFSGDFMVWRAFWEQYRGIGGDPYEILEVFGELHRKGVELGSGVLAVVLDLCTSLMESWLGLEVHASLIKKGYQLDVYLTRMLMRFYGRCWGVEYADKAFDEVTKDEARLWDEAIMVNLQNGNPLKALQFFRDMQLSFVKADQVTVAKALQACAKAEAVVDGKQIHGYVIRNAMEDDLAMGNSLITMYCKAQEVDHARRVFDSMDNRSTCTWNSMISGYASIGSFDDAWKLFNEMESRSVKLDNITWNCLLSSHFQHGLYQQVLNILRDMLAANIKPNSGSVTPVIQAITELKFVDLGKEIHCYVIRNGLDDNEYVGTTLLGMYVKNDLLNKAKAVFDLMKHRKNVVTWNSLISGYSSKGLFFDALNLLHLMEGDGIKPDIVTWNSLVSGYSMNSKVNEALAMMNRMKASCVTPNVVSWTALISGCSKHGNYKESFRFFSQMLEEGVQPNMATYLSLLPACGSLALLHTGKEIHCLCLKNGFYEDVAVATGLVDMYVKSGSISYASRLFWTMRNRTLPTWNCMIMGYATYNRGKEAIKLFEHMLELGIGPDTITFTALLSACKNSALLDEGWKYFDMLKEDYCLEPTIEHYSCMVDLLGRAGYPDEACDFINTIPMKPDASIWGSLLSSCRMHNELELGKIAAANLFELEPYNSANYVMMMNLYSMSNRWADVDRLKDLALARGVQIKAGWSWIQIESKVHIFNDEDPHPDSGEIYFELYQLISEMKAAGYVPDVKCVYQNIEDVEKEKVLQYHPEKLAIAYGLIKTSDGSPIRVIKNTKICSDCHTAAKLITLVRNREILLKDGARFHHFKEGNCSCGDCW